MGAGDAEFPRHSCLFCILSSEDDCIKSDLWEAPEEEPKAQAGSVIGGRWGALPGMWWLVLLPPRCLSVPASHPSRHRRVQ